METRIKRTQRDYTLAFKQAVVDQVEKGELTYKAAQHQYGIQGHSTVLVWLHKHGRQDWRSLSGSSVDRLTAMKDTALPLTPEQRIKALEKKPGRKPGSLKPCWT